MSSGCHYIRLDVASDATELVQSTSVLRVLRNSGQHVHDEECVASAAGQHARVVVSDATELDPMLRVLTHSDQHVHDDVVCDVTESDQYTPVLRVLRNSVQHVIDEPVDAPVVQHAVVPLIAPEECQHARDDLNSS